MRNNERHNHRLRTFACWAAVAVLAATTAACGDDSSADTSGATGPTSLDVGTDSPVKTDGGQTKIALLVATTLNEYNQAFIKSAEETAKAMGATIQVFDSAFDATAQANQIANAIQSKKFNAIIAQPVDSNVPCKQLSEQAPAAGIAVSIAILPLCDRVLETGDELWAPGTLNFVGGQAQLPSYEAWAKQVISENPGPQKVLLLSASPLNGAAKAFNAAVAAAAEDAPDFEVLTPVETDFTTPVALTEAQNALEADPDITIVLSILSDVSRGAITAIKEAGLEGDVRVYDVGASQYSLDAIAAGDLQMSMPYFPASAAAAAVTSLVEARKTGEPGTRSITDDGKSDIGDFAFITEANVADFTPEY